MPITLHLVWVLLELWVPKLKTLTPIGCCQRAPTTQDLGPNIWHMEGSGHMAQECVTYA